MGNLNIGPVSLNHQDIINAAADTKEFLQKWDISKALASLGERVSSGIDSAKEWFRDLFRVAEKTKDLNEAQTQGVVNILDQYLPISK